jgi:hypothetical protein
VSSTAWQNTPTRPSCIPPLPAATVDRVAALTSQASPHDATHWTAPAMAKTLGISPSSVRRIWKGYGLQPHRMHSFKLSNDPKFAEKLQDVVGLHIDPPGRAGGAVVETTVDHTLMRGSEPH